VSVNPSPVSPPSSLSFHALMHVHLSVFVCDHTQVEVPQHEADVLSQQRLCHPPYTGLGTPLSSSVTTLTPTAVSTDVAVLATERTDTPSPPLPSATTTPTPRICCIQRNRRSCVYRCRNGGDVDEDGSSDTVVKWLTTARAEREGRISSYVRKRAPFEVADQLFVLMETKSVVSPRSPWVVTTGEWSPLYGRWAGVSLRDAVRVGTHRSWTPRVVLWILHRVALAISTLHSIDVVHRDLHAGNVLLKPVASVASVASAVAAAVATPNNSPSSSLPSVRLIDFELADCGKSSSLFFRVDYDRFYQLGRWLTTVCVASFSTSSSTSSSPPTTPATTTTTSTTPSAATISPTAVCPTPPASSPLTSPVNGGGDGGGEGGGEWLWMKQQLNRYSETNCTEWFQQWTDPRIVQPSIAQPNTTHAG
jgi:hypothetical protein